MSDDVQDRLEHLELLVLSVLRHESDPTCPHCARIRALDALLSQADVASPFLQAKMR